jgi:hypothetical protein
LAIRIKTLGDQDPAVAQTMSSYAVVLHNLHREQEALALEKRAQSIQAGQNRMRSQ